MKAAAERVKEEEKYDNLEWFFYKQEKQNKSFLFENDFTTYLIICYLDARWGCRKKK